MAFRRVAEMCEIYLQGPQQVQAGGAAARRRPQNLTHAGVAAGRRRPGAPLQGLRPLPLPQSAQAWNVLSRRSACARDCSIQEFRAWMPAAMSLPHLIQLDCTAVVASRDNKHGCQQPQQWKCHDSCCTASL
jgi:hypothetical protein